KRVNLNNNEQLIGYKGEQEEPLALLFKNNELHLEIQIDENDEIGKQDKAHVKDIVIESAITSIMDCEDSVAAVDAEDKVEVYRHWKGLIRGESIVEFE